MRRAVANVMSRPDFRRFWIGQSASVIGDRLVVVALALYVTNHTGSATDVGLVLGAHAAPLVLFMLVGGVWADRLPRHRVVVATDLVRAALHGLLAVLILTGEIRIWQLVVIEVAFGTAEAFFRPARTALIPQLVPEELIQDANAISGASDQVAELLGPALATALIAGVGAGWAFALDASTFMLSAVLLSRVRPRPRAERSVRRPFSTELREGFAEVRSRSWVWVTISVFSIALLAGLAPWYVLGPTLARGHYGSTAVFGVITIAFGVGAVAGALLGLRWRPERPMRAGFVACAAWPVSLAMLALGAPLVFLLPVSLLFGTGFALFLVWWETALAERIPAGALSRVTSYDWVGSLALMPLGYVAAGPIAGVIGADTVLLSGAALTTLALVVGLFPRQTRSMTMGRARPDGGGDTAASLPGHLPLGV